MTTDTIPADERDALRWILDVVVDLNEIEDDETRVALKSLRMRLGDA